MAEKTTHLGRKIGRLRELRGIKQETLAEQLGISQQAVSKIEQSESVDEVTLERIGKALGISAGAIKNFNEDSIIFHIENMNDHSSANYHCTFNPLDKYVEAMEDNKKLYEALLKSEQEKVALLEKVITKLEGK